MFALLSRRLVGVLVLVASAAAASPAGPLAAAPGCTFTIPASVATADGAGNYAQVAPGHVVCLQAGSRGSLKLVNFRGTAAAPITFVNAGGVVRIASGGEGIQLLNSEYVRLTGSGTEERCGAPFAEGDQGCGIVVSGGSGRGISGIERTRHVEIDHVEVGGSREAAINLKDPKATRSEWEQDGVSVHHAWIHDITGGDRGGAEAMYIGMSTYDGGASHLTRDVEVAYNRTARIGWESYQVGSAVENCRIHHNVAERDSLAMEAGQTGSIVLKGGSRCDVTDNTLVDGGSKGVFDYGSGDNTIAGNLIVRPGGKEAAGSQAGAGILIISGSTGSRAIAITDNRIDSPKGDGIRVGPTLPASSVIRGNRVAHPGGAVLSGGANAQISDNALVASVDGPAGPAVTPTATPTAAATATGTPQPAASGTAPPTATSTPGATAAATASSTPVATTPPTQAPTSTVAANPSGSTLSFTSIADAHVRGDQGTVNFGTEKGLEVDGAPLHQVFIKFRLTGISGTVQSAKLQLFSRNTTVDRNILIGATSDTGWEEMQITYNTRPAITTPGIAAIGPISKGRWYEADVTRAVAGDGLVSLTLTSGATDGVSFGSRESNSPPQLVITLAQ